MMTGPADALDLSLHSEGLEAEKHKWAISLGGATCLFWKACRVGCDGLP